MWLGGDGSSNSFSIKRRKTPALAINTECEWETFLAVSVLCSDIGSSGKKKELRFSFEDKINFNQEDMRAENKRAPLKKQGR